MLVVDVTCAFTESDRPLGADCAGLIAAVNRIIGAARSADVPLLFTRVAYDRPDLSDAGLWSRKIGRLDDLRAGGGGVQIDPRLDYDASADDLLTKKYASCFFGTDLTSRLTSAGIDTLVITGLSTSGCIRATAVDAVQLGFRPIIVEEAVGDRWSGAHTQSLADLQAKYADVLPDQIVRSHAKTNQYPS